MAQRPTVRWKAAPSGGWRGSIPDGARKVERVDKAAAERDLDELLARPGPVLDPGLEREKLASFADVIDAWFAGRLPQRPADGKSRHTREKSPNTVANARQLLGTSVLPSSVAAGRSHLDRTPGEAVLSDMADRGYATSTIDRNWNYLNQACQHALRDRRIRTNPAAGVMLPAVRPSSTRKSFTIEQAQRLLADAIPADSRPAMWLTGTDVRSAAGELAGLRWATSTSTPRRRASTSLNERWR